MNHGHAPSLSLFDINQERVLHSKAKLRKFHGCQALRSKLDEAKDDSTVSVQELLKNAIIEDQKTARSKISSISWDGFESYASVQAGQGLKELRDAQLSAGGEISAASYLAPEPPMKFIKREADRTVERAERLSGVARAAAAARDAAVAADLTHWGVLRLTGADRLSFLNGLCTAKLVGAAPGDARDACFVNKASPPRPAPAPFRQRPPQLRPHCCSSGHPAGAARRLALWGRW